MHNDHFPPLDPSPSLTGTFDAVHAQFGFVPDSVARLAHAPEVLQTLLRSFAAFERTSLPPLAREAVIMTVARRNGCDLCLALHSAKLAEMDADAALHAAMREGTPLPDPALEAVREFTLTIMDTTGDVGEEAMSRFLASGYTQQQALEILQGIGTYTFSTFANRMTGAAIDEAFAPFGALTS